jgi:valyl-tRNA synthetase
VYIHALVRDMEGQKMSKSKGNVIDPLVVMDKYGTDAFRFTLAALAAQGRDIRLSEERIEGYRNFANKIWNAARFVLSNLEGYKPGFAKKATPTLADRWIRSRFSVTVGKTREALRAYRFNDAAAAVYHFLWHEYCDWYLEISKLTLYREADPTVRAHTQKTLVEVLEATLRLLHPFMPFITEEIWQRLPKGRKVAPTIMVTPYPRAPRGGRDEEAETHMGLLMQVVGAIRNIRGEMRIPSTRTLRAVIKPADGGQLAVLKGHAHYLQTLARVEPEIDPLATRPHASAVALAGQAEVYVPLEGVVDLAGEARRLEKEIRRVDEEIEFMGAKLGREEFR